MGDNTGVVIVALLYGMVRPVSFFFCLVNLINIFLGFLSGVFCLDIEDTKHKTISVKMAKYMF